MTKRCENCNWFREFCKEPLIIDGHCANCFCAYNEVFIQKDCFCAHWEAFGEEYYFFRDHAHELLKEVERRIKNEARAKD